MSSKESFLLYSYTKKTRINNHQLMYQSHKSHVFIKNTRILIPHKIPVTNIEILERKNTEIIILVNTLTRYCSCINNGCPMKIANLLSNILFIHCSRLLILIWYSIPFIYNYQTTLPFRFNLFCNFVVLGNKTEDINPSDW